MSNPDQPRTLSQRDKRSLIFHVLYAYNSAQGTSSLESVVKGVTQGFDVSVELDDEVMKTIRSIIETEEQLDTQLEPFLDNWRLDRLGTCTLLIMRFALWELLNSETPTTIVLNEAIELAKCFTEQDAYKFINGVLDRASRSIRKDEVSPE
ncbi:transcription antitermination factor NusB [bacterium]|jgi:transcription antitermination protein NusB|nr:transcription antitermination factor NusB [bacterium]MBT3904005.1 transcription antitermination factor NusB [bacterium]MBT4578087.1 transcription antitermination factor NusB [bacterium]MBT5346178.1 transcription antitermination factor NusB [bacterium]MBT6130974.1 transcription antitermination factor NusB [bacterium]